MLEYAALKELHRSMFHKPALHRRAAGPHVGYFHPNGGG
jgi:hypothetical protein